MIRLELPHPPKGLQPNRAVRLHWRKKVKLKSEYRQQCWACAFNHKPKEPMKSAKVRCIFYHKTSHKQDDDNLIASMKAAFDGLVDAKVFTNDNELTHLKPVQLKDKNNPRVIVEIEP